MMSYLANIIANALIDCRTLNNGFPVLLKAIDRPKIVLKILKKHLNGKT